MAWRGLALIGVLGCSLALALTGCTPSASRGGPVSADALYALPRAVPPGIAALPSVLNQLNGDIIVVTGSEGEIALDAWATGTGTTREAARVLAGNGVAVTNADGGVGIRRVDGLTEKDAAALVKGWLHLRVPPDRDLPTLRVNSGNIEVYGRVGKVTAIISGAGDITVRGANGDVDLTTQKGSIIADVMRGRLIKANAKEGNLDICAVDANHVKASTTLGWIRFIGTLLSGQTHEFVTTGAGSIQIALPMYPEVPGQRPAHVYRVYATTTGSPISTEYPAYRYNSDGALPICGFIYGSGPYDYHVENTAAATGRIEISPALTKTYFFTGTLSDTYYRFDTDQTYVAFYTPVPQSIHIYTSAQLNQIIAGKETIAPDCAAALNALSPAAAIINLKTDRGPITIQHIRTLKP